MNAYPQYPRPRLTTLASTLGAASVAALLTACGTSLSNSPTPSALDVPALHGNVHGGQQPLSGATIQLYAAGTTGLHSASTALLNSPVTTDAGGNFIITGKYTCPASSVVYITATGGNPGLAAGTNNSAIALMTALGPCINLTPGTNIAINEVTTVGAVSGLGGFMTDLAHIGTPATNLVGMNNAFLNASSLADPSTGFSPGPTLPATATLPVAEINTLANIIAACVNSSSAASSPCASLFSAATTQAGTPNNTINALLNIEHAPANNVATLFNLAGPNPPFQPQLTSPPKDFTVAIVNRGGGLSAPYGLAIDQAGSVWVTNQSGPGVVKFSSNGTILSGPIGYTGGGIIAAQGIAITSTGNVFVANTGGNNVVKLDNNGNVLSGPLGYTAGINGPVAIAIDAGNNAWVANYNGASVAKLDSSGAPAAGSPFTAGGNISLPDGIAIDSSSNVWISNSGKNTVIKLDTLGNNLSGAGFTDGSVQAPLGIAIDQNQQVYVANNALTSLSAFNPNGTPLAASPLSSPAIVRPTQLSVSGEGFVWITNSQTNGTISNVYITATPSVGYGTLNTPVGISVDNAGSIWTADSGDNTVTQFVGLSVPVTTPLVARRP